jgi:hypothetical protein
MECQWKVVFFFLAIFCQISIIHFYFLQNGKITPDYSNYNHQNVVVTNWSKAKISLHQHLLLPHVSGIFV